MGKAISVQPKKRGRGRPASGGRDPIVGVRFPEELIAAIDREAAEKGEARSEVIRRLVEQSLKHR